MANLYDAYDKKSDKQGLGWADQWDYKQNDKYGHEGRDSEAKTGNKEKLAKVKQAASAGVDKTKQVVTSGAQKVKSGTTSGIRWIKEKVQRKPTGPHFDGA
ncbi:hypothetical protein KC19_11G066400 [Ceratodon purpureus]|uniref:Uncharacterized protein n=1 Tax=Ceratodon purpureus TaxID=3225 RepID=A0A8T0GBW9_CERPU|nr:hypothetical protein KC19_11G066400 [Ceratodon purpureus]